FSPVQPNVAPVLDRGLEYQFAPLIVLVKPEGPARSGIEKGAGGGPIANAALTSGRPDAARCADGNRAAGAAREMADRATGAGAVSAENRPSSSPPHGIRRSVTRHVLHLLRLNSRLQDFRPAGIFYSRVLLGGNKHIETFQRSLGCEGRL